MIEELRSIGLSDLEARIYLVLLEEPEISGYEVAKRVSVSRTNVYAALRALTDKGVCRTIEAEPVLYDAVPIAELIRTMKTRFDQTSRLLLQELDAPPKKAASFYSWKGEQALRQAMDRVIANSEHSIIVDVWSEDFQAMEEALLDAEGRGVRVIVMTIGKVHTPLKEVITHLRSADWEGHISRKFSVLADGKAALIGSFGKTVKLSALETDHPSIIELLKNGFYHDLVGERIERDFGDALAENYGKDYEKIIASYRELLA